MDDVRILIAIAWLVCAVASYLVAQGRGATNLATWFLLGAILGPIGLILALLGARPPKGAKRDDAMATLSQLAQMRADGAITSDEYEAKKRELLGRV
jgi:putative oligomerization/nucleic acid binding protein